MARQDVRTRDDLRAALVGAGVGAACGSTARGLMRGSAQPPLAPGQRYGRDHAADTGYDPATHGWALPNRFYGGPRGRWIYGLCGGLCYAALDYWAAGLPPPRYQDPTSLPASLYAFVRRRQLASMAPRHLSELGRWLLASDAWAGRRLAAAVVPSLCAALDAGRPVPVMLVRRRGLRSPWDNHQALAYGYRWEQETWRLTLALYDPNHPGVPVAIRLELVGGDSVRALAQSTGEPLRGLFPLRYRYVRPPIR